VKQSAPFILCKIKDQTWEPREAEKMFIPTTKHRIFAIVCELSNDEPLILFQEVGFGLFQYKLVGL
jgi:hypothetical protein